LIPSCPATLTTATNLWSTKDTQSLTSDLEIVVTFKNTSSYKFSFSNDGN